ncbi:tyrosine-protein phosphatase [Chitinophaga sp. 22321]|uniref:Tyrosine-protein phosphatase n=1 Tax=Chitinophaga hostae TaxID=2831022 RepID=A0ABS5J7E9_9BACT|nr:tyrosine-protein phosphatase [Chitinophaga hostae]MBS0031136.1 tyrosine-protein phosphatase [Chitinophaga hostae]
MKKIILALAIALPGTAFAQLSDSAQRVVRMQGTVNFRDVGGYKTQEGRQVVWGKVFRSADVSRLTAQDLSLLEQKHIHTVIDFRGVKEAAAAPDHLLPHTDYLLCPAGSDSLPGAAQMAEIIKNGGFLEKFYGNTQYLGARYKPLFQKLLTLPASESIMYHCTGGRDRTGMATALFLYALGVPQSTIEADFTASNVYLQPMNRQMFKGLQQSSGLDEETIRKALELKPELLHSLFDAIRKQYGTVDNFFEKELGIGKKERAILVKKYTES